MSAWIDLYWRPIRSAETAYSMTAGCHSSIRKLPAKIEKLSIDPKYIGGKPGMIGVLHTWSRTLVYHPHVHYIVTGGGLLKEKNEWVNSRGNFLLPVKALSIIFRAKWI